MSITLTSLWCSSHSHALTEYNLEETPEYPCILSSTSFCILRTAPFQAHEHLSVVILLISFFLSSSLSLSLSLSAASSSLAPSSTHLLSQSEWRHMIALQRKGKLYDFLQCSSDIMIYMINASMNWTCWSTCMIIVDTRRINDMKRTGHGPVRCHVDLVYSSTC